MSEPRLLPPDFAVSDGAHEGGTDGFYFLPPLVPAPFFDGTFNPNLRPRIDVFGPFADDGVGVASCGAYVGAVGTVISFAGSQVAVNTDLETYSAGWQTGQSNLASGGVYRICVNSRALVNDTLGWALMGYRDVKPTDTNEDNRSTNQTPIYTFKNGSNLPITFRIESGALGCGEGSDVGACTEAFFDAGSGGTAECPDGTCAFTIDGGAVNNETFFSVTRGAECNFAADDANPVFLERLALPQYPGCLVVETSDPAGTVYDPPVIVAACVSTGPALDRLKDGGVLNHEKFHRLQLHHELSDGTIEALPNTFSSIDVDCTALLSASAAPQSWLGQFASAGWRALRTAVLPSTAPKPAYAVNRGFGGTSGTLSPFVWAMPAQMEKVQPLGVYSGYSGEEVAVQVKLTNNVTDPCDGLSEGCDPISDLVPVQGARVSFDISGGDGTVVSTVPALTGADGIATATWKLGSPGIPHALDAHGYGIGLTGDGGPFAKHYVTPDDDGIVLLGKPHLTFEATACTDKRGVLETEGVDAAYGDGTEIPINLSGATGATGTLYWTADCYNVYFALSVPATEELQNSLRFVFVDGDNVEVTDPFAAVPLLDDDIWNIFRDKNGVWQLEDWHVADDCKGSKQSECGKKDQVQNLTPGGNNRVVRQIETLSTVYEFAHSLGGSDDQDFPSPALGGSEIVGFYLALQMGKGAQGNTEWPGFRIFKRITIERK